ncbi:2Fe-2S iron-sulfur cluster binding protein [Aureococcus anophagefferens]|uniref:2Fe-2S iron-sulfur cluster binding protein n=1 Tax=Aureococcus anophagefferens TaxID=44056 RepID=A0ABR1FJS5_AURAN
MLRWSLCSALAAVAALHASVDAFGARPSRLPAPARPTQRTTTLRMGFFDNAFKNEDMGAAKPAGGAQKKTVEVKVLGKPMQALPGQRLKDVVRAFNCENGKCGTCERKVNGRKTRLCVTSVPQGGCAITKM